ncbi:MAG TPA: hypothetical protein VN019_07495 [Oxalicibacterium sp.]|nr:hypothetical protein [Oxalicibacterium sp.]
MRSTKATAAVERLKERSGNEHYAMVMTGDSLFYLVDRSGEQEQVVSERLPLEEFVTFVKTFGPQKPRKATKSDLAFEKQLVKKPAADK